MELPPYGGAGGYFWPGMPSTAIAGSQPFATIELKRSQNYAYHVDLVYLRNHRIDETLRLNHLVRRETTVSGNNCLLDTIFQQICSYLPEVSFDEFATVIRTRIQRTNGEMLSINDEKEGVLILTAVAAYITEKTGQDYGFDPTVLFADNAGDIARVDMSSVVQNFPQCQIVLPLRIILVNYNHYEPLFPDDVDPSLIEQLAHLEMERVAAKVMRQQRILPVYIANIPLKVDSDDEEESSSDEEIDDTFSQHAFNNPASRYRLFPKEEAEYRSLRGKVLNAILPDANIPAKLERLPALLPLFDKEAAQGRLQDRLSLSIGFNKMRSLSARRNRALSRRLNESVSTDLPVGKIGFFWDGVWQKYDPASQKWTNVAYEEVRRFYRQLKRVNSASARRFRADVERNRAHMVPYREIRDMIKNHEITKKHTRAFRTVHPQRAVYIVFLDSDLRSFHRQPGAPGAFSVFDDNYLSRGFVVCSTGYTLREPKNLVLEVGVLADMCVRQSTARHLSNGIYFPEPCTACEVPLGQETIPENFSDPAKRHYSSPQEMPRLIAKILKTREIDPQQSMIFDMRGAIVTTTPSRMQRTFACRATQKNGIILWGLPDFKTMRGINQSHFNARDWALNLLPALSKKSALIMEGYEIDDQAVLKNLLISLLSRLFNAFDPVEIAERRAVRQTRPFQICLIEVLTDYQGSLSKIIPATRRSKVTLRKNVKDQKEEANRCKAVNALWSRADSLNTIKALEGALRTLLAIDRVAALKSAARECGESLVELFSKRLCLNYDELIVASLAGLIDEKEETIRSKLPKLYSQIMQGNSLQARGGVTKREIAAFDPSEFYGVSILHFAALVGNLDVILWVKENCDVDLTTEDDQGKLAFDYALVHCQENGVNLDLLIAVCDDDILDIVQEAVSESVKEIEEIAFILNGLLARFGESVIGSFDDALFLHAVQNDYTDLAEQLAHYGDTAEVMTDAILDLAPEVDERFMNWVGSDELEWVEEQLRENCVMQFRVNRGADNWLDECSEPEYSDYEYEEEEENSG